MNDLNKKNYLIFGAAGDIGTAVVSQLNKQGAETFLISRNKQKLKKLSKDFGSSYSVINDINFEIIENSIYEANEKYEKFDGVVNCIGSLLLKPAHLTTHDELHNVLNTNLSSSFGIIKHSIPVLDTNNGGSIVLISSAAAEIGLPNHDAIAAAKAGINGLVKSSAASYSRRKIRINAVAPGLVETNLTNKITSNETILKKSEKMHPLGRIGKPEDIASAVCWLLAPEQSWLTAQVIYVDGGLSSLKIYEK